MNEVILPLLEAFQPQILVTQLGVDSLRGDPLTSLGYTTNGFLHSVEAFKSVEIPWLALGGGGYNVGNVARAWTLGWAAMNGVEPPDEIPDSWNRVAARYGVRLERLRDEPDQLPSPPEVLDDLERTIGQLKEQVFPIHSLR